MAVIRGNGGNNTLRGTGNADTIYGYNGNDTLLGLNGIDRLLGGAGSDRLRGGADKDFVRGEAGNDWVYGDAGDDNLYGDNGNDNLFGGAGNDTLYGGNNNDILRGESGNDTLRGGAGADTLHGDVGNDLLFGDAGADVFVLRSGVDTIADWDPAEGDQINLWPLLNNYDPETDNINDFVRAISSGGNTRIVVDANGRDDGRANYTNVAVINDATYTNFNALLAEGSVLVPGGGNSGTSDSSGGGGSSGGATQSANGTKDQFMDFLGINIKIDPSHQSYGNGNRILNSLDYLGLGNVRVAVESPIDNYRTSPTYDLLANNGYRFDFFVRREFPEQGDGLMDDYVTYFRDFLNEHPDSIKSLEGINEVMSPSYTPRYKGWTGKKAATEYQKELYRTFDADPVLDDIPLYNFTVWRSHDDFRVEGYDNVSNFSDGATVHSYILINRTPYEEIPDRIENVKVLDTNSAPVMTETGYPSQGLRGNVLSVNEATQAKLILNQMLNAYDHGLQAVYLYELFDKRMNDPGDNQSNFGIFKANGAAKPSAHAIHNFTTILDREIDSGPRQSLGYNLVGDDPTTHSISLEKKGGVTDLIIWREDVIWDHHNARPIPAPVKTITVEFDQTVDVVDVYDPIQGTSRLRRLTDRNEIDVQVSDHPIILEIDLA